MGFNSIQAANRASSHLAQAKDFKRSHWARLFHSALSIAFILLPWAALATPPFALNCNTTTPGAHCPTPNSRPLPEGVTRFFGTAQIKNTTALFLIEARALTYLTLLKHQPGMTVERFRALSQRLAQQCGRRTNSSWLLDRAADQPQAILQRMATAAEAKFQGETEQA